MDDIALEKRLTRLEDAVECLTADVAENKSMQENIHTLALSIERLAGSMERICIDLSDHNVRIKEIETKPNKRMDKAIDTIIGLVLGALVAYILRG